MASEISHIISASTSESTLLCFPVPLNVFFPNTTIFPYNSEHWPKKLANLNFHVHFVSISISSSSKSYSVVQPKVFVTQIWSFPDCLRGKIGFTKDLPIETPTLCVIPYRFSFLLLLSTGRREVRALQLSGCLPNVKTSFPTCCCSHCVQIRSGPQRSKALMFWACVNTTREGQRVHVSPTIEHQSHWNSVI